MVRNLDHRIEAACPVLDKAIRQEILEILQIQLSDNVKARMLTSSLSNEYATTKSKKKIKSQVEIYNYLYHKKMASPMHERHLKNTPPAVHHLLPGQ
jgi:polyphosphate kinase